MRAAWSLYPVVVSARRISRWPAGEAPGGAAGVQPRRRLAAAAALGVAAGTAGWVTQSNTSCREEQAAYLPPPQLDRPYTAIKSMPTDKAGKLAWAVKNLEVDDVKKVLKEWPQGAELLDEEGNTLFHLAASEPTRYAAQPQKANEVVQMLLKDGWAVVDAKNQKGERAEIIAARGDPKGPARQLLVARSHAFHEKFRMEEPLALVKENSPVPEMWEYLVEDEQRRSWAGVLKQAFPPEKCREWMAAHMEKGMWMQPKSVPRKTAWYVSEECADCPYRYSGLEYPATVFPDFMLEIREEVCKKCGIPPGQYPNSCNVNVYYDQSHEVGWHSDDEVMFQGLCSDTCIISFSLGVPREFCWRLQGTTEKIGSVQLGDGDIMTMEGLFQKHYKHCVPPSDGPCAARINMTFRWIKVKAHAADASIKGVNQ